MNQQAIQPHAAGCVLRVRVLPNAAKTGPQGLREDGQDGARLALRVKAPPVEGKANAEVLRWAADFFGLRKNAVSLARGDKSRQKDLLLEGLSPAAAAERLGLAH